MPEWVGADILQYLYVKICVLKDYYEEYAFAMADDDVDFDEYDSEEFTGSSDGGGSITIKPRQHFPETWLWQSVEAG